MTDLRDALSRMVFLRNRMEFLVEEITAQGFRTEEQSAEAEMLVGVADDIQEEVAQASGASIPEVFQATSGFVCRSCGRPVHRQYGMWLHVTKEDFTRCGKAAIPRGAWGEQ